MVQITGRLTGDAEIKAIGDKEVVNFTIAINDYYKPKGKEEGIEQVTFVQCGYWFNTAIAATLRKGAVIEAGGRLFATAYMKGNEPQGRISMQVQYVKVHAFAKKDEQQQQAAEAGLFHEELQQPAAVDSKLNRPRPNKPKPKPQPQANQATVSTSEEGEGLPF